MGCRGERPDRLAREYVAGLSQTEKDRIALYLNFDMVASPNYIFMVYDGDQSGFTAPVVVPQGPRRSRTSSRAYYTKVGQPYDDAEFSGRSTAPAFILAIPRRPFTGAEVVKSQVQEDIWGGVAGESFDQCYHQACDTLDNLSVEALDVNIDAIATAVLAYSYTTESVNGVVGEPVSGGLPRSRPRPGPRSPGAPVVATTTTTTTGPPTRTDLRPSGSSGARRDAPGPRPVPVEGRCGHVAVA